MTLFEKAFNAVLLKPCMLLRMLSGRLTSRSRKSRMAKAMFEHCYSTDHSIAYFTTSSILLTNEFVGTSRPCRFDGHGRRMLLKAVTLLAAKSMEANVLGRQVSQNFVSGLTEPHFNQ